MIVAQVRSIKAGMKRLEEEIKEQGSKLEGHATALLALLILIAGKRTIARGNEIEEINAPVVTAQ